MRSFTSSMPVKIRTKNLDGADENRVRVFALSADLEGLSVQGVRECVVRLSRLRKSPASFIDCRTLQLDGLKIESSRLEVKC